MKKWISLFMIVVGLMLMVGACTLALYIRWANPDMTEIRLFIEFWPEWIVVLCAFAGGLYLVKTS